MSDVITTIDAYFAMWNEPDPTKQAELNDSFRTPD